MKIAVIGAAERTGRHAVEQALARGDEAIAIARAPEKIGLRHNRLTPARAEVRDRDQLAAAIGGADALISALGLEAIGPLYADMRRMKAILGKSRANWVALRAPDSSASRPSGHIGWTRSQSPMGRTITYHDLATALLDSLTRDDFYGHAAYVAN